MLWREVIFVTKQEYADYIKQYEQKSPLLKNIALAYLVGGAICTLGQGINDLYMLLGLEKDPAAAATSITLVFLGAFFTALRLYGQVAKFAGAGTIVPITGFANSIVSPAMEFKSEGFITGMSAKMFTVAGPVLVFGLVASVVYGIILFIFR